MAGARRITLEMEGVVAEAELYDDLSPKTAEAFWKALPVATPILTSKWCGAAGTFRPAAPSLGAVTELENPVCSIYPGTLVVRPGGGEALIAHAASEYRSATGPDYVTRVARIVENRPAFLARVARLRDEGKKQITIRRKDA